MPAELPPGLLAWARLAGPARLLDAVRVRAVRGFSTETGTVQLELAGPQRREVARLLGTAWEVSGRPAQLRLLSAALAEHGLTVRGFVEALDGAELVENSAVRGRRQAEAEAERAAAAALLSEIAPDVVHVWLTDPGLPRPGGGGLLALAERVAATWPRLPGQAGPPIRLAQLAATVHEDAHALDHRQELGRAVARLAALANGLPRPLRADRDWRRAWAAVGVWCDEVSSQVLTLNLPLSGDAPAARWARAAAGEPLWLTLRSLTGEWGAPRGTLVRVCENPTVLEAAADELGPHCPPLVCTDGIPSFAALGLIARLHTAGCQIQVRADVDEAGFVVVQQVRSVAPGCALWRFDAATYRAHTGVAGSGEEVRELFAGHRVALHEEALLGDLLADLAADAQAPVQDSPSSRTNR